jgi:carotenoid cleavage dioxygenase-like enzyme
MTTLIKVDVTAVEPQEPVGCIQAAKNVIFGEVAFVPREPAAHAAGSAAVDDGYLITYANDMKAMTSACVVRAARSGGAAQACAFNHLLDSSSGALELNPVFCAGL